MALYFIKENSVSIILFKYFYELMIEALKHKV